MGRRHGLRLSVEGRLVVLLRLRELLEQGLRRVKFEGKSRLANGDCGGFLAHLLALQVPLQCVKEQAIMRHAIPIENLLLLLRSNAIVLVEKV